MKRSHLDGTVVRSPRCLLVPARGRRRPEQPDVVCPQDTNFFSGTARDLIVPEDGCCFVIDSTITRDLIVGMGRLRRASSCLNTAIGHDLSFGGLLAEANRAIFDTTIGHDIVAGEESGFDPPGSTVGHDVRLLGPAGGMHSSA